MITPLHERLAALHEYLSPPSANALSPPALELLGEAIRALTPPPPGKMAPTSVPMPWPTLPAGFRLVTSAYTRPAVADYGDARAAERDAFWREVFRVQLRSLGYSDTAIAAMGEDESMMTRAIADLSIVESKGSDSAADAFWRGTLSDRNKA